MDFLDTLNSYLGQPQGSPTLDQRTRNQDGDLLDLVGAHYDRKKAATTPGGTELTGGPSTYHGKTMEQIDAEAAEQQKYLDAQKQGEVSKWSPGQVFGRFFEGVKESPQAIAGMGQQAVEGVKQVPALLQEFKQNPKSIAGYGAAVLDPIVGPLARQLPGVFDAGETSRQAEVQGMDTEQQMLADRLALAGMAGHAGVGAAKSVRAGNPPAGLTTKIGRAHV